jgi:hypothetical protein
MYKSVQAWVYVIVEDWGVFVIKGYSKQNQGRPYFENASTWRYYFTKISIIVFVFL